MEEKLPGETAVEPTPGEMTDSDLDQVSGGTVRARAGGNHQNSDSELSMIQLQSLVSQRQQAIQMTTNMVKSENDSTDSIIKNIGR